LDHKTKKVHNTTRISIVRSNIKEEEEEEGT